MKKILLWLFALIPAMGMAQNTFTVKIKIGNLNPPAKAYLFYKVGKIQVKDSALMYNGMVEFTGDIPNHIWGYLTIDHDGIGLQNLSKPQNVNSSDKYTLCLDKGYIMITSKDSLRRATYTGSGSTIQNEYQQYMLLIEASGIRRKRLALDAYYRSWPREKQMDTAYRNQVIEAPFRKTMVTQDSIATKYIKEHPDSYVSVRLLMEYVNHLPVLKPLYAGLSDRVKKTPEGMYIANAINVDNFTAIGSMAPAFTQNDVNDKPVSLADFKGKYVLLDFWASWCGPCRAENPNYVQAYHKYKNKNFTFLGVSLDQPGKKDAWLAAIQKDGLEWTQVSDLQFWNNDVAQLYKIKSIPANYLIDPTGKIIAKNLRGDALNKKLAEILGPL